MYQFDPKSQDDTIQKVLAKSAILRLYGDSVALHGQGLLTFRENKGNKGQVQFLLTESFQNAMN